jgi:sterol O-acyltransferase
LDRSNPVSAASPFIGFYTLFWLGLSLFTVRTFLQSYRITGRLFGLYIISILKKDVFVLGLFDAFMFASTFICVPLQKAIHRQWIAWNGWGWILQHVPLTTSELTSSCGK